MTDKRTAYVQLDLDNMADIEAAVRVIRDAAETKRCVNGRPWRLKEAAECDRLAGELERIMLRARQGVST
jgi:hypothetical protein